ncbi:hypothetical protein MASR2M18_07150 [Ignavibacteria bacterium]|nr:DUF4505 family protein [Bacteroidota bacterium]MCZ2132098.1 DUF4505 family protein [Bacteroidota bacterium]
MTALREYFFDIDAHGVVYHEGGEINDAGFLDFFYRQMRANPTGKHPDYPYFSPCQRDRNFIRATDTPIIFHRIKHGYLEYAATLRQAFSPDRLRFSDDGILYHPARVGEYGRLSASVIMELSQYLAQFGPYYALKINNIVNVIEPLEPLPHLRVLHPREGNMCVGCGAENPAGLRLSFLYDENERVAQSWLTPDERTTGSLGIMHGGFVSLLLDEVMGKVLSGIGVKAPTARLSVEFRRPVTIGEEIALVGRIVAESGRKFTLKGEIHNVDGIILAEAEALFIQSI